EVIAHVRERYGEDRVAHIITFGRLQPRAVLRDVGRVMGLPYGQVDRIAKLVPDMTRSLAAALEEVPKLKEEAAADPQVARILEVGSRLEGLTRHASVHAAGVVITPRPIEELVPLYKTSKDEVTTQWDKDVVEGLGLLKIDFLGLRTLTVIDDAVRMVRQQGQELDLDAVPLDDPEVYRLFCEGRTNGVFQFESRGMKDLLRRAKPSKFEDLAAFNALYRPGALSVGMVDEYIRRKQGAKRVTYVLPETRELLEETYGVIVYQEQVMQIAVEVAGFTLGEADVLRKAMGKKKLEVMLEQKQKFADGAAARGVPRAKAEELWDYIEPFAGYGFNKSHSVAYAMLAYKTAYLKAHHPVAFMAAMLNSELSTSDSIAKYVRECQEMDIRVLPPDVNASDWWFTVDGGAIRFGLGGVKGVGEGAVEEILAVRRREGRFRSLTHFASELDGKQVNHKVFDSLIKAGCFDSLGSTRRALLEALDPILGFAQQRRHEREVGQSTLFGFGGGDGEAAAPEPEPEAAGPEWPEGERLSAEKEALGFYLTGNPLSEHEAELSKLASHTTADLKEGVDGPVTLGGLVTKVRPTRIKSGKNEGRMMGRFVLEDLEGAIAAILFADTFEKYGQLLEDEAVVLVKGMARERGSDLELNVEEVVPLKKASKKLLRGVDLVVDGSAALSINTFLELRDLLREHHGDTPVRFQLKLPGRRVAIAPEEAYKVRLGPRFVASVEGLLGQGMVRERYG
ncbi:MAG TPA: DNA polymerase III subunit alpha, partial [Thermoanaerobaculia bacterium]|nr:DNA polymerase III subunit alpha [Thermoanaerobaculia bacterium]